MLYYSKKSKVAHFWGCHHLGRILVDNAVPLNTWSEARRQGVRICKCCNPVWRRYKAEQRTLTTFCAQNGLAFYSQDGLVSLKTMHSQWKIVPTDDGGIELFHRNTRYKKSDALSPLSGYHLQKFRILSIIAACRYVLDHDAYRLHTPAAKDKQSGVKTGSPKGSRKWRAQQKRNKKKERRNAIKRVLFIFDQLEAARARG